MKKTEDLIRSLEQEKRDLVEERDTLRRLVALRQEVKQIQEELEDLHRGIIRPLPRRWMPSITYNGPYNQTLQANTLDQGMVAAAPANATSDPE